VADLPAVMVRRLRIAAARSAAAVPAVPVVQAAEAVEPVANMASVIMGLQAQVDRAMLVTVVVATAGTARNIVRAMALAVAEILMQAPAACMVVAARAVKEAREELVANTPTKVPGDVQRTAVATVKLVLQVAPAIKVSSSSPIHRRNRHQSR